MSNRQKLAILLLGILGFFILSMLGAHPGTRVLVQIGQTSENQPASLTLSEIPRDFQFIALEDPDNTLATTPPTEVRVKVTTTYDKDFVNKTVILDEHSRNRSSIIQNPAYLLLRDTDLPADMLRQREYIVEIELVDTKPTATTDATMSPQAYPILMRYSIGRGYHWMWERLPESRRFPPAQR